MCFIVFLATAHPLGNLSDTCLKRCRLLDQGDMWFSKSRSNDSLLMGMGCQSGKPWQGSLYWQLSEDTRTLSSLTCLAVWQWDRLQSVFEDCCGTRGCFSGPSGALVWHWCLATVFHSGLPYPSTNCCWMYSHQFTDLLGPMACTSLGKWFLKNNFSL